MRAFIFLVLLFIPLKLFSQSFTEKRWFDYLQKTRSEPNILMLLEDNRVYKENELDINALYKVIEKKLSANKIKVDTVGNSPNHVTVVLKVNYFNFSESTSKNVFLKGNVDVALEYNNSSIENTSFTVSEDILIPQSLKEIRRNKSPDFFTQQQFSLASKLAAQISELSLEELLNSHPKLQRTTQVIVNNQEAKKEVSEDRFPPEIQIFEPSVTRGLKVVSSRERLTVKGHAKDPSGVFSITINNAIASIDENGNFTASIPLAVGENNLSVVAKDVRMNEGRFDFKVSRPSTISPSANSTPIIIANKELPEVKYYALIIGIQDYQDEGIVDLEEPLNDATLLYQALVENYTFEKDKIKLLKNPSRNQIYEQLELLLNKVTENDNLLIFYAGHGYWDEKLTQGYWLPSDSKKGARSTYLSNADLRDYIGSFRSKHTLLISDACFAGSILKTRSAFSGASTAINELFSLPSRKAMTSGAMKEVPDKSVFIEYLVKRLKQNSEKYLPAESLFSSFRTAVINNSANGQVPQYGEIKEAGDEGGEFIFVRK